MKRVLAIESSCDETSAAVVILDAGKISVLSNIVASQIDVHKMYGGVVPEVAARLHGEKIIPVIDQALNIAMVSNDTIDTIAVTQEPGLPPSLLVGQSAAEALAFAWQKPLLRVNHLYGHIYSTFIDASPEFPLLGMVASGGHTGIWYVEDFGKEKILGQTLDDAVGEAFDKVAQLLGLPYPGGPQISKRAESGNSRSFDFPRPMVASGDLNFSFSGLKTAVLTQVRKIGLPSDAQINDLSASFQAAVVDTIHQKISQALLKNPVKSVILAGGVAANPAIRRDLRALCEEQNIKFYVPELKYCGDNAAMIAAAALLR